MGVATDIMERLSTLATRRTMWEPTWQQVADVAAPEVLDFLPGSQGAQMMGMNSLLDMPRSAQRSARIYDTTAVNSVDRLAAGIEALAIPQSEYWHGFGIEDLEEYQPELAERQWLERLNRLFFRQRYDADSGWIASSQTALRRMIQFGTGLFSVEDGYKGRSMIQYRYWPLANSYIDEDHCGRVDTWLKTDTLTARQYVQRYSSAADTIPAKVIEAANDPKKMDDRFQVVTMVSPRGDFGPIQAGIGRAPYGTVHIDIESQQVIRSSGYWEFPLIDFRWLPETGRIYGEGPLMRCLADVQSLNVMAKNEMTASQQSINPPLLVASAGVMNRPVATPGGITYGGMTANGQRLIEPLFSQQRQDFHTMVLEAKRNQVKDSMYINLFALLVKNPQMSATEAMIRASEKGELLGPAGARIQESLSRMVEREMGILSRRGLFDAKSAYRVPRSIEGADVQPQMSGPLNKLRRTKEAEGTVRTLQVLSPLMQIDPSISDNFDADAMTTGLAEIMGMPAEFVRDPKIVAQMRQQRAQQQAQAQQAEIAQKMATAGKQGSEALNNLQQTGL